MLSTYSWSVVYDLPWHLPGSSQLVSVAQALARASWLYILHPLTTETPPNSPVLNTYSRSVVYDMRGTCTDLYNLYW